MTPREAPPENGDELSAVDIATRALGRLAFFEGLAGFPVDYADMDEGLVAFRFPPLNSCIVAERQPEGAPPKRCRNRFIEHDCKIVHTRVAARNAIHSEHTCRLPRNFY